MNKAKLGDVLAERTGTGRNEIEKFIGALVEIITETIKSGEEVTIAGFGSFSAHDRKGRVGVNPRNLSQQITIPTVRVPKFKAGIALKKAVRQ